MNYKKYSKKNFAELGRNTPEARTLADQLEKDVTLELHKIILPKFQEIISKLNAIGHNLRPYEEIEPGDISFRDEALEKDCYLRLACDFVISSGYAHTISIEEAEQELFNEATGPNA